MRILAIFSLLIVLTISCNRDQTNVPLSGTWRLMEIKDKSTGAILTYPAGSSERIILTINGDGSFTGKTRVNIFDGGSYTVPANGKILFGSFVMLTKVAEDQLGSAFLTVLHACGLQSVLPCLPSDYIISGNRLEIKTALRYDVKMVKQ
jgi:hypothetical protein